MLIEMFTLMLVHSEGLLK